MKVRWESSQLQDIWRYLGARIPKDLCGMYTHCSTHCSGNVELNNPRHGAVRSVCDCQGIIRFTCIVISQTTCGAGLTRVISCAAAEVTSDPADWMSGCMRGASDSRVNGVFDEGRTEELAVRAPSIL